MDLGNYIEALNSFSKSLQIREEIGVTIKPEDLTVVHVMHRKAAKDERIDFFMTASVFEGEIVNNEPDKCDDLQWFSLDNLPTNMVEYVRLAIEHYLKGNTYSEYGY